jgi:hypothetical protein
VGQGQGRRFGLTFKTENSTQTLQYLRMHSGVCWDGDNEKASEEPSCGGARTPSRREAQPRAALGDRASCGSDEMGTGTKVRVASRRTGRPNVGLATPSPREARYQSLRADLESAHRSLPVGKQRLDTDGTAAWDLFRQEVIRTCRADSRLLAHPVVERVTRLARAFGDRAFLLQLPGGLEKGIRRPLSKRLTKLFAKIDQLRWSEQPHVDAAQGNRPATLAQQVKELRERRGHQRSPDIRVVGPLRCSRRGLAVSIERAPTARRSLAAIQRILEAQLDVDEKTGKPVIDQETGKPRYVLEPMSAEGFRKLVQKLYSA